MVVNIYLCFPQFKGVAGNGQAPFDIVFSLVYRPVDRVCRMVEYYYIIIADVPYSRETIVRQLYPFQIRFDMVCQWQGMVGKRESDGCMGHPWAIAQLAYEEVVTDQQRAFH